MKQFLKRLSRTVLQLSLAAVSFALVLAVALQLALVIGVNMFSKGRAHELAQAHVTAALADSGYNLTFAGLYYDPVRGFTLYDIALSDRLGPVMNLDRLSLAIDLVKMPRRLLVLEGHGGTLTLIRLPAAKQETPETQDIAPFEMPDIFFRRLQVALFKIERLDLPADLSGVEMSFSPVMRASVDLRQDITFDFALAPQADRPLQGVSLPERITGRGHLDPRELQVQVDQLSVRAKDYKADATGMVSLRRGGAAHLELQASYADLTALTQGQWQSLGLNAVISGPRASPALAAEGVIVPAGLREKGLSDIKLDITTKDAGDAVSGLVKIVTAYRDQPVTLDAEISYNDGRIAFDRINGTAPGIALSGQGALNRPDMMFDGTLSAEVKDLSRYQDLTGLALAGAATLDVTLAGKDGAQTAAIDARVNDIQYNEIRLDQATIKTGLADVRNPWPEKADIKASGLTLTPQVSVAGLTATIRDKGHAVYQLSLNGHGKLPQPASFSAQADIADIAQTPPTLRDIAASVKSGSSTISLSGALDKDSVALTLAAKDFRSADIPLALPEQQPPFAIDATIKMTGTPAAPVTTLDATLNGLAAGHYKELSLKASGEHENQTASLSLSGAGTGIRALQAQVALPLRFALYPFALTLNETGLNGSFASDIDIAPMAALFIPPALKLSGGLDARGTISGALSAPVIEGMAHVRNGSFDDSANGIRLRDISLAAALTHNDITLRSLHATDGEKGTLQGQGHMTFGTGGNTDLTLTAQSLHLPQSKLADGYLDAELKLSNTGQGYIARGTIDITQMDILIPARFQSDIPELNIIERHAAQERRQALKIDLGIKINADNQVFVRGWGLDAEFGGEIDITGDIGAPQFNGTLSSLRGRYEEFGKRFTLARADLRFQGGIPPSPYLDIEATIPASDVTAAVLLTGPAGSPSIKFAATPALPEDEVLSRILFGRGTARITPFQAVQLTQTIQRFSGNGGSGFDPLGLLRSTTGLDDLTIDTDETGAASVGVGKYLSDKVHLEVEKGKGPASGAASIQIEITPQINVESEIGQDTRVGGGIFWKRDY